MTFLTSAVLLWPLFLLSIWRVGCVFYEEKKKRIIFSLCCLVLYLVTAAQEGREIVLGIYKSSWSGLTILSCIVMPLMFSCIMQWFKGQTKIWIGFAEAAVLVPAGQLCDGKGGFYVGLMVVLYAAVVAVGKGYDYVLAIRSHKKGV